MHTLCALLAFSLSRSMCFAVILQKMRPLTALQEMCFQIGDADWTAAHAVCRCVGPKDLAQGQVYLRVWIPILAVLAAVSAGD